MTLNYIQQYADSNNQTTYNFDVFTGGAYPTRRLLIAVAFRIGTNTGIYTESMSLTVGPNTIKFRKVAESRNWNQYASCIAWFEGEVPEGTRATVSPTLSHEVLRCGVTVYSFDGSEYEIGPSYGLFDGNNTDQSSRHGDFDVDLEPGGIAVVAFARSATAPTLGGYEPDNDGLDLESNVFFIQTGQYTNQSEIKSTRRIYEVVSSGAGAANACLAVVTLKPGSNNCPQELIELEPRLWFDPSDVSSTNWGDDDGHLNTWMNKSYLNSIDPIHTPDNDDTSRATINGLPAIRGYGASFTTNANSTSGMTDGTVYCVCVSYGSGSNSSERNGTPYRFSGAGSAADHFGGSANGLRGWYQSLETTSRPLLKDNDPGIFEGEVYLQKLSVENDTLKPSLNGRSLTEVAGGTQTAWGAGTIGTASTGWKWQGLWGELILLDTVPDAATDALITNYLMTKWGIGVSEHVPEEGEVLCIKDGLEDLSPYKQLVTTNPGTDETSQIEYTHNEGIEFGTHQTEDRWLDFPDWNPKASTDYVLEFWVKSNATVNNQQVAWLCTDNSGGHIVSQGNSASAAVTGATVNSIYVDAVAITDDRSDLDGAAIDDNEIHHVVMNLTDFNGTWTNPSNIIRFGWLEPFTAYQWSGSLYSLRICEGVQWDLDKIRSKYRDGYHFNHPDKWLGLNGEVASLIGSRQVYKLPDFWNDGTSLNSGYRSGLFLQNVDNFEIDFYVRLDDMTDYNPLLVTRGPVLNENTGFVCDIEETSAGGRIRMFWPGGGSYTGTIVFKEDRTYHIIINKRDNSLLQVYVDGVIDITSGALTFSSESDTPLVVGIHEATSGNDRYLNGEMWGIRVAWGEGLNESGGKRFFLDDKDNIKKGLAGFITTLQTSQSIQLANFQHPQNWTYVIRVQRNNDNNFTLINRSNNAASYLGLGVDGNASTGSSTFTLNTLYVDGRRIDSPSTLTRGDWYDLVPEGKTVTIAVAGSFSSATEYNQTHTWQFGRLTTFTTLTMRGDWSVIRLFNRELSVVDIRLLSLDAELQLPNTNGAEFSFDPAQEKWMAGAGVQDLSGKNTGYLTSADAPDCWQTDGGLTTHFNDADAYIGNESRLITEAVSELSCWAWIKTTYVNGTEGTLICGQYSYNANQRSWMMAIAIGSGAVVGFASDDGLSSGNVSVVGTTDLRDGNWHYVGMTFTAGKLAVYVDGLLETIGDVDAQTLFVTNTDVHFRMLIADNNVADFQGNVGYSGVSKYALTEEDHYHLYQKTCNRYQADVTVPTLPPSTTHYYTSEEPINANKARTGDAIISSPAGLKVRDNSGFVFDGTTYLAGTRHRTVAISKMSAAAWVKIPQGTTTGAIAGSYDSAGGERSWLMFRASGANEGKFAVGLSQDGGNANARFTYSPSRIDDGAWHSVGFVFDPNADSLEQTQMFIDGEDVTGSLTGTFTSITELFATPAKFAIGASDPDNPQFYLDDGLIDRATVAYDEVWSPSVFRELYEAGPQASIPALPTQRYHRDAVAVMNGSTVDQSGNNNALTAAGSATITDGRYTFGGVSGSYYSWGTNTIGPQLEGAEGFGFVGFIYVDSIATNDRPLIICQDSAVYTSFGINFNSGSQLVAVARSRDRDLESASTCVTVDAFPTSRPVHVAVSVDFANDSMQIWLDAVEVSTTDSVSFGSDTYIHSDHTAGEVDAIGGRSQQGGDTIDGWMSDVQIIAAPIDEGFVKEHARREGAGINRWDATHHPKTVLWLRDGLHDSSYSQRSLIRNKGLTVDQYGVITQPAGFTRVEIAEGTDFTSYTLSGYVMNKAGVYCGLFNRMLESGSLANTDIEAYTQGVTGAFTIVHNRSGAFDAIGSGSSDFPNDVFTHVTATYDEATTTARIYANGVQVAEDTAFTAPTNTAGRKSWIGHWGGYNSSLQSGGELQDIRIIEQAVTAGYAALLWNKGVPGKEIKRMVAGEVLDIDPSLYKVEWPHDHLFDGTAAARIDTPIQIPQGDYEWECNFNIAVLEDYGTILAQRNDSGGGASFNFRINADGSGTYVHVSQGTYSFPTGFFVADRDYHFRIVYDHSTTSADFYVDGELIAGNQSLSGFNASTTTKVTIGARPDGAGSGQEFTGRIWGLKFAFGGTPDESGNNPPAASTPFSNGLSVEDGVFRFAGTSANQQIVFDDVFPSDDSDRTICCLVKFDDDSFETNATFGIFDTAPGQVGAIRLYKRGTSIGGDNNGLNIEAGGQTAGSFWEWPSRLNGKWVSLILTANRSDASVDINLYVQGVYVFSRNTTGSAPAVNTVRFGALNNTNPMPANSYMAGMKVFDRVLTDEEISRVHAHMMGKVSIQDFAGAQYLHHVSSDANRVGQLVTTDLTGKNPNGVMNNMTTADEIIDTTNGGQYALEFDGTSNNYVDTNYVREHDGVFEIGVQFRMDDFDVAGALIGDRETNGTGELYIQVDSSTQIQCGAAGTNAQWSRIFTISELTASQWYTLHMRYISEVSIELWIDAVSENGPLSINNGPITVGSTMIIGGRRASSLINDLDGKIDGVITFNRLTTQRERRELAETRDWTTIDALTTTEDAPDPEPEPGDGRFLIEYFTNNA